MLTSSDLSEELDRIRSRRLVYLLSQALPRDPKMNMASDLTTQVGCGVAKCDSVINVVCHYNTTLANAVLLYTIGPSCNRCPQGQTGCTNGLCPAA
ncbi:hypothetical protein OESDEN_01552 [Oesophagostomum dentatum]|uniref:SCP domain-containing protein n=1 Tax=Oesophagostomum dentatum TaxID=61180 RepID=A0A0B1TLL9_OESDE|nr:hypothetical protein OESDEN_01552 [Oesophagostomum dentatum]